MKSALFKSLVVILIGGVGFYLVKLKFSPQKTENEYVVKRADLIQRVTFGGTIEPLRKSTIMPPYKGYVGHIFVKVGDKVKLGDPLVTVTESLQSKFQPFPLRSPINGVVTQIEKREGEATRDTEAKDFIMRIEDTSKLFVVAAVPEIDRAKIKIGFKADIKAVALGDKKYHGILRELALAAKDQQNSWSGRSQVEFNVRAEVIDADESLISGMSILMDVVTDTHEKVLLVGHEYLSKEADKNFVTTSSGITKEVTLGLQNEESFEVLSGIVEGEILRPVDFSALTKKL